MLIKGFMLILLLSAAMLVVLTAVATMIKEWEKDDWRRARDPRPRAPR
jgi:hypothetical protein